MMDKLDKDSSPMMIKDAISAEMEMCMKEPPPEGMKEDHQKYCAGKAYGMAREASGKTLDYGK